MVNPDGPSAASSPRSARNTPNATAAEPVAGSSGTPDPGANIRRWARAATGSNATTTSPVSPGVTARTAASSLLALATAAGCTGRKT